MMDFDLLKAPIPGLDPWSLVTPDILEAWQEHAMEVYPNECLAAIVGGQYVRVENSSSSPEMSGDVSPEALLKLMQDGMQMFLHSHPDGPDCPSGQDIATQKEWDVPFGIISTNGTGCLAPIFFGDTLARPPLLGRGFLHGVHDCVGLILDYEEVVHGRVLDRPVRDWEWWSKEDAGEGLYEDNFKAWGYEEVNGDLEPGDVIFLRAGSKVVNHAAVYLGDHLILHHLAGRLENDATRCSTIEPLVRWQQHQRIARAVRYKKE